MWCQLCSNISLFGDRRCWSSKREALASFKAVPCLIFLLRRGREGKVHTMLSSTGWCNEAKKNPFQLLICLLDFLFILNFWKTKQSKSGNMLYNNNIKTKRTKHPLKYCTSLSLVQSNSKTWLTPPASLGYLHIRIQYSDHLLTPPASSNPIKGNAQCLWVRLGWNNRKGSISNNPKDMEMETALSYWITEGTPCRISSY